MLVINEKDLQKFLDKKFKTIRITTTQSIIKKIIIIKFSG